MARAAGRRPHHLGAGALAAGIAACAHPAAVMALAVTAAALLLAAKAPRPALIATALLVGGAALGTARLHAIDAPFAAARHASHAAGRAVLLERPRRGRFDSSAAVELLTGPAAGARALARVRNGMVWPAGGAPGTVVWLRGPLSAPRRHAGERLDWPAYLRRRGIAAELKVDSLRQTGSRRAGIAGAIDGMRTAGERMLDAGMPRGRAAVARGMVLGEDEQIDPLVRDDFRRSGLAHVLAVSGQNVMLLCALATPLLAGVGLGPRGRVVALAALIALYVPLAGAGPSLQRAGVMGVAGLIALGAGRVSSRWYALLLAADVTLAVNPRVVDDPGWQLSFTAVVGILVLAPLVRRSLRGLPRALAEGVAITLAATLATAPLLAHHFGAFSVVGVPANLVAIPLVASIMWAGMTQVALGVAAAALPPAAAPFGALAFAIGRVDGVLVGWLDGLARYFGALPGSHVVLPLRSPVAVCVAYVVIAAAVFGIKRVQHRTEPRRQEAGAAWRRAPYRFRIAAGVVGLASCAAAWQALTGPPDPPSAVTVSFLDVGQGDATLIQDGPRAAVLFDGGPPEARVARLLREAGVRRLALVVATHQSRDHQGGLAEVLASFDVGALLDGGDGTRDPAFNRTLARARATGAQIIEPRPGQVLRAGRLSIRILGPPPRPAGTRPPDDPNLRAVTAVVSEGWFDLFLSADAESPAILGYPLTPVDAMKVPHHGSADPGMPAVLARLRPAIAAIEVGAHNSYGHPAAPTLAALRAKVARVYRTDRDGTVRLTIEGRRMRVTTAR